MTIQNTLLLSSDTSIFQATVETAVTTVILCNTSPTSVTVNMFLVPNGGTASTATTIVSSMSINANDTFVFDSEKFILSTGDKFSGYASIPNVVAATISYIQMV